MTIHHFLIGSVPSVERYRFELDAIIRRYEAAKPSKEEMEKVSAMTPEERSLWIEKVFADPKKLERMADGALIELCAQHFYGLKGEDFDRVSDLIDAIRGMDDDLEAH